MPQGDRTGPQGQGKLTGRGMGFCTGFDTPGFANFQLRRECINGFGRGFGLGFRRRNRAIQFQMPVQQDNKSQYPTVITEKEEKEYLEVELKALKQETEEIQKRLKELKK